KTSAKDQHFISLQKQSKLNKQITEMIFSRCQIFLFTILALCCLFHSIDGGKIPKISTKANDTEITSESVKAEITTLKTPLKKTENKSTEEDDDDDIEDDAEDDDDDDDNDNDDDDGDESANAVTKVEKNAVQPAADTSLSVWGMVRSLWDWIKGDISESFFDDDGASTAVGGKRTYICKIRRLQMALIPLMFKFGVLSAMVAFLVAVGLKTLFLVKVLIGINLLAILAKFFTLKTNFGHVEHVAPPTWNWTPYVNSGWQSTAPEHAPPQSHINKEIHLHIHGAGAVQPQVASYSAVSPSHGWERRNDPYSAYETMALQGQQNEIVPNDLSGNNGVSSNIEQYNVAPQNHRML
ncbi:hypothetical protein DOY81_003406, partial [Sarcophaga bullata]